jgi:hypothetical protein
MQIEEQYYYYCYLMTMRLEIKSWMQIEEQYYYCYLMTMH